MKLALAGLSILLAAATLNGCATLSEHECLTADWESIGYRDGSHGHDAGRVASHSEACAEHGISPDRRQYEEGRVRGLELFCTGNNGVRIGRQGSSYSGVCPEELEGRFLQGYDHGRRMHEVETHMQQLSYDIQRVQADLRREEPPLKDSERDALLYRLRSLEREYGRSESELRLMEMRSRDF